MTDRANDFAQSLKTGVRQLFQRLLHDQWEQGFNHGAETCLDVPTQAIDELEGRLGSLSKDDQIVLRRLRALQTAMEEELRVVQSGPQAKRDSAS